MNTTMRKKLGRFVAITLSFGVFVTPALMTGPGQAATQDPKYRQVTAPNVFYPVQGSKKVKDLRNYSRKHRGTDIKAPCYTPVFATHPGTVQVLTNSGWYSKYAVRVISGSGGLVTTAAYLPRVTVANGQIVQAGQQIGYVGTRKRGIACRTYFAVSNGGKVGNPTSWLNSYVGKPAPVSTLFGAPGMTVVSFNVLGASHTRTSSRFAAASARTPQAYNLLNAYGADVVGMQEFQDEQVSQFLQLGGGENGVYGIYYFKRPGYRGDTDNAIIWRNSTMELVSSDSFEVPYFNGNTRRMPIVLLRQKATGRTAYFMNVHNPADTNGPAQKWRNEAVRIERAKMIELRATGRPVFLTGDFNDRQEAFCPLTAGMLSISPNSIPSMTCRYPKPSSIDWIFAAGQTRFTRFVRDTTPQKRNISDHPIVVAEAHLQN